MTTLVRRLVWPMVASVLGALAWVAAASVRLTSVDSDSWQWRDDAVITLSHALNYVEFGSIGVSPGGDRVEGFSAPLHFLLGTIAFALHPTGYRTFIDLFVWAGVGTAGALAALIAWRTARLIGYSQRIALAAGLGVALLSAFITVSSWTSIGWLASGMENPLLLILGLLVLLIGIGPFRSLASPVAMATAIGLLGLARIELPALLLPCLVAAALVLARQAPPQVRRRTVLIVVAGPAALWLGVTASRFLYFGDLLPNTAVVQGKASGFVSFAVVAVITVAEIAVLVRAVRSASPVRTMTVVWVALSAASAAVLVVMLAKVAVGQDPLVFGYWYPDPGYIAILTMLTLTGAAMTLITRKENRVWPPDLLFATIALMPVTQYLAMGPARLDVFRVASIAVPLLAVWLGAGVLRLARVSILGAVVITAILLGAAVAFLIAEPVRGLCCKISPSEERILAVSDEVRSSQLGGQALPIVATADLGKLSFAKRSVIVDLGWLGDPVLARLHREFPELEARYLADVAAPDVVEMHGGWPCWHAAWFDSPEFTKRWRLAASTDNAPVPGSGCAPSVGSSTWVRADAEAEYALTQQLAVANDPAELVGTAIATCAAEGSDPMRCQGVRRAVTRTAQVLRERGLLDAVVVALADSPSAALDIPMVVRGPGWADEAVGAYTTLVDGN